MFRQKLINLCRSSSLLINLNHSPLNLWGQARRLSFLKPSNQLKTKSESLQTQNKIISHQTDKIDPFNLSFQVLIEDIYSNQSDVPQLLEAKQWLQKALEYNIHNGKRNRGNALLTTFRHFCPEIDDDENALTKVCLLAWCVELLQSIFLIYDDIMDNSTTRRGQLCWYRNKDVGMIALNDGLMIQSTIYFIMKKYFSSSPNYIQLIDLFNSVTFQTTLGQCLDLLSSSLDFSKFTEDRYDAIVKYKTGYYSFSLPIRLALYLANITDQELHSQSEKILLEIGQFFQVQDDYLDCFGDPKFTGKIGTDIEDGKCSWLVVKALKLADPGQRSIIEKNYGIKSEESVDAVKQIYNNLNLKNKFRSYENAKFNEITSLIEQMKIDTESSSLKAILFEILKTIHERQK
ncbi:Farnesyl pyrophosphate synthase [Sarcoptes scabiei]|uniref:Farnesyl pyrophosphate synthase n=1 Tax=Sarcoptes scabiei TaxID=52283 RepID=A0A834RFS3_SARSC|nr:Farnesyl pyrophosphate synthase [Sarcoptes scabiei]